MSKKLFALIPGLAGALLPNATCPACWPIYAGVLSSLGLGFLMQGTYFYIVIGGLLSISLVSLFYKAKTRHGYGSLWLGIAATVIIFGSKYFQLANIYLYSGAVLLIAASLWNNWPRKKVKKSEGLDVVSCPACQTNKNL